MVNELVSNILKEIGNKLSKLSKLSKLQFNLSDFFSSLTKNSKNYAIFSSLIYIIILIIIYVKDPYNLHNKYPIYVLISMLFLFLFLFLIYLFIDAIALTEKGITEKVNFTNFIKMIFAFIGCIIFILLFILLSLWLIKKIPRITNITSFIFKFISIVGFGAIFYILYNRYSTKNGDKKTLMNLITNIIFYIPCLLIALVEYIKKQWNITTSTEVLILGGEIIFISLAYILPIIYQKIISHDGDILLKEPQYLSSKQILGNFQSLSLSSSDFKYNYSISAWFNIFGVGENTRASYNDFTNIINYANKPNVQYNAKTNTLRIQTSVNDKSTNQDNSSNIINVYSTNKVMLQKWNNIVINYDAGNIDIFLNGELVGTLEGISPYIKHDSVTCGEDNGIEGGICNVIYYNRILSNGEIILNYKLLSKLTPPIL
mgnify:CR=1 FL=1|tara:strand:+ start:3831 stop:5120 length:1290 start_codon:yes stop_codon:yes gene_type:complete